MKKFILPLVVASILLAELPEGCKGGNEDHFRQREEIRKRKESEEQQNQQNNQTVSDQQ